MRHRSSVLVLGVTLAVVPAAISSASPVPVSPVGQARMTCPTFSWSSSGDTDYQLVVYGVDPTGGVETTPLISQRLPAGTRAWTPSVGNCLQPGESYAWSLRTLGESPGTWSEPALFEVATSPSVDEVEAALATLRRYLRENRARADGRHQESSGTSGMPPTFRDEVSGASSRKPGERFPRGVAG
ncbi:MAG: hypothetical protein R3324_06990, partial [Halobacteriales archaeon]|nr:hypothetical protein [Halobacteriales archaeon]